MTRPPRQDALTGIRIFAAFVVLFSHLPIDPATPHLVQTFMMSGYNGVTFFFLLSGFVLAWNYSHLATPTNSGIWSFLVGRFARIYPLYLVALAVAAVPFVLNGTLPDWWWMHALALQAWSADLQQAVSINSPGWSIGVELFLYALFPLLVPLLAYAARFRRGLVIVGCSAFGLLFVVTSAFILADLHRLPDVDPASAHRWLYRTPLSRLADFAIGAALGLSLLQNHTFHRYGRIAQAAGVGLVLCFMASSYFLNSVWSYDLLYAVPSVLVIWGLVRDPNTLLARLLRSKPLVYGGTISYGVYLFHVPVMARFFDGFRDQTYATTAVGWSLLFGQIMVILVTLLIAAGSHEMIEKPCQRWIKRRFSVRPLKPSANSDSPSHQFAKSET